MVDRIETLATDHAKALFGAEHAYVQPHSGIDAKPGRLLRPSLPTESNGLFSLMLAWFM